MRLLGIIFYVGVSICTAIEAIGQTDSLAQRIQGKEGLDKINVLHTIVTDVWLNYPADAMKYGQEALTLSRELEDSAMISKSLRLIAGVHYYKGDYDKSLEYNQKAFSIGAALKDSTLINNGYNNIGLLYYNLGSYQTALEYLLRSKTIKDKIGETYALSTTLNNIGLVFERVKDYQQARKYFTQAYDVANAISDRDNELYSTNNIGITYLREGNLDEAIKYFRKGANMGTEFQNINWGAVSLRGIGEVYMLSGRKDSVLYYLESSLNASRSIDDKKGMAEGYFLLAKNALSEKNFSESLKLLGMSNSLALQIQIRQQQLDNLKLYSEIYARIGDNKMENEYLDKYIHLRDSLFQDAVTRNLNLIPVKIQEEEGRFRLSSQQAEIRNQLLTNQLFTLIITITIPLLIIMVILYKRYRRKAIELQRNNEELKHTQSLLITSEKMASLGVLAAGVGHEINNPLNFIKNGVEAISKKMENNKDDEMNSYLKIVNEGVSRATNIVKSLSHFSRKGHNMEEVCNLQEIIENCLLILHNKIRNKVNIVTNFTKLKVNLKGNEGRLHQAMMNILANAEQAINGKGTIEITTLKRKDHIEIWIEDDGEGIPEDNLMKISDPFFTTKAPGDGTGLGLFITFSIIEEHNGNIEVTSNMGEGTKFTITLPLKR
ncbi:tetratricopeptide repeat-containing sensor histidine kinase [Ekhidna sp.]